MELHSLEDTKKLAKIISKKITKSDVIFLYGEIGVGKTTFIRFLINQLEAKNKIHTRNVLSPTFTLVYDYDIWKIKILHYDLYRIKNNKDVLELGIFDDPRACIKIIEWPELIKPKPKDRLDLVFKYSKHIEKRKVKIIGYGKMKEYKFDEF